jgi:DNA repair photolyase
MTHPSQAALIPLSVLGQPAARPGIAGMAAAAAIVDYRNEVCYAEIPCKTLLAACDSPRVPFQWSINPYRGCEYGCTYCYARYTHEFMELRGWDDFERRIFVKRGAAAALVAELRRNRREGEGIAIGTATDPYQPAERRFGVTRSLLRALSCYEGMRLSITTKSNLILRDLSLLQEVNRRNELTVNITVTTQRAELARILEPRAPRPDLRLAAVDRLAAGGLPVGVFMMPVMPRINDALPEVGALMAAAAAAGAQHLAWQVLFLRACSRRRFLPWIGEHFPALVPTYRRLYGPAPMPLQAYTRGIAPLLRQLVEKHGLSARGRPSTPPPPRAQPDLNLG